MVAAAHALDVDDSQGQPQSADEPIRDFSILNQQQDQPQPLAQQEQLQQASQLQQPQQLEPQHEHQLHGSQEQPNQQSQLYDREIIAPPLPPQADPSFFQSPSFVNQMPPYPPLNGFMPYPQPPLPSQYNFMPFHPNQDYFLRAQQSHGQILNAEPMLASNASPGGEDNEALPSNQDHYDHLWHTTSSIQNSQVHLLKDELMQEDEHVQHHMRAFDSAPDDNEFISKTSKRVHKSFADNYPQIIVRSINLANFGSTDTPYSFTVADPSNPDYNTLNFQMNLTMDLGTYNPNLYDFKVTHIDLEAYMIVNTSQVDNALLTTPLSSFSTLVDLIPPPANHTRACNPSYSPQIGSASYGYIVFPAKATVNYTMLFLLSYSPDPNCGLLYDPTINEIADACGVTSRDQSQRSMDVRYNAQSTITLLQKLGFTPSLSGDIHINCPFSNSSIKAVVADVKSGMSIMQAVDSVFGGGSAANVTISDNPDTGASSTSSTTTTVAVSTGGNSGSSDGGGSGGASTTSTTSTGAEAATTIAISTSTAALEQASTEIIATSENTDGTSTVPVTTSRNGAKPTATT
ncbi:hypothetical protein HDU84_008165 [Entophlyctis sp. JEL0112]|nr:hypothetical protein HDU84_008165 [Entophlyctis sp. JEL0112]